VTLDFKHIGGKILVDYGTNTWLDFITTKGRAMQTLAPNRPMGRKKSETPRNDATAKVDAGILEKAKFVALDEGKPLAELLSDMLRDPVEKRYVEAMERRARVNKPKR